MKRVKIEASVFLLLTIILILAAGIIAAVYALRTDPAEEALSVDRVINMLFVIEKDSMPLSSYVLMYYPTTKRAAVFDIPGDLGLIISRIKRVDRIDRVYNSQKINEFIDEIKRLLGIDEINFWTVITIENLGKLVDLLEGVELFIPGRIQTRHEDRQVLFSSGLSRLDGDMASLYVSYESSDDDRDVAAVRRQRFFIALLKQLGTMNSSLNNPAIGRIFHSYLNTSMSQRTCILLFNEFSQIDTDRIGIQAVGGNMREVSNQTLLLPYYDGNLIKEIVRQTRGSLTRRIEGAFSERVWTVELLNGTSINGLAKRTEELLRSFGYDVILTANADRNNYEKTVIYDRSGYEEEAKIFADIIHCKNVIPEMAGRDGLGENFLSLSASETRDGEMPVFNIEYRSDFKLILGSDFDGRYVAGK